MSEPIDKKPLVKKREKPGRPPKNLPVEPKEKLGIIVKPDNDLHYMEFLYDNPLVFKKLWNFFKLMSVAKIHITFMMDCIVIYCNDHAKKNYIRVKIDCTKVNKYYCEKELDIGLLCKNPELVMNTIDKSCDTILFVSTKNNIQKNIEISLTNNLDIEENHKIELIGEYDKNINDKQFLDDEYAIKFKLNGKYFKKMVTDIRTFSDQLSIIKDGPNDKLTFEYTKTDKKINSMNVINNSESISLIETLGPDESFRTSVKVDYIKPVANAILNDTIEIYADENKHLKFISQMDEAIQIIILTEQIDNRL